MLNWGAWAWATWLDSPGPEGTCPTSTPTSCYCGSGSKSSHERTSLSNTDGWISTTQSDDASPSSKKMEHDSGVLFCNWLRFNLRLYWTNTISFNRFCSKRLHFLVCIRWKTLQLRSQPEAFHVWLNIRTANFCKSAHWLPNYCHQYTACKDK